MSLYDPHDIRFCPRCGEIVKERGTSWTGIDWLCERCCKDLDDARGETEGLKADVERLTRKAVEAFVRAEQAQARAEVHREGRKRALLALRRLRRKNLTLLRQLGELRSISYRDAASIGALASEALRSSRNREGRKRALLALREARRETWRAREQALEHIKRAADFREELGKLRMLCEKMAAVLEEVRDRSEGMFRTAEAHAKRAREALR